MSPSLTTNSQSTSTATADDLYFSQLAQKIKMWGKNLGLQKIGFIDAQSANWQLQSHAAHLQKWLDNNHHGTMHFMQKHGTLRTNPTALMPQVASIICCRLDWDWAPQNPPHLDSLNPPLNNYIVSYAQSRDYHKIMRQRLKQLALQIEQYLESTPPPKCAIKCYDEKKFAYRVFCDSAPILEKALAAQAGLGWIGKNTLLINEDSGSHSFLGEIYTNLPLADESNDIKNNVHDNDCKNTGNLGIKPSLESSSQFPTQSCGSCSRCLDACPTKALYAPHSLNASRCIAYLTIEHQEAIPHELRPLIGTRIFGCDICQKCCPWNHQLNELNKISPEKSNSSANSTITSTKNSDLKFNNQSPDVAKNFIPLTTAWQNPTLAQLFLWDETTYLQNTAGTPLRRLGYEKWLRNIAIALGNADGAPEIIAQNLHALETHRHHSAALVREHVNWAIDFINYKINCS